MSSSRILSSFGVQVDDEHEDLLSHLASSSHSDSTQEYKQEALSLEVQAEEAMDLDEILLHPTPVVGFIAENPTSASPADLIAVTTNPRKRALDEQDKQVDGSASKRQHSDPASKLNSKVYLQALEFHVGQLFTFAKQSITQLCNFHSMSNPMAFQDLIFSQYKTFSSSPYYVSPYSSNFKVAADKILEKLAHTCFEEKIILEIFILQSAALKEFPQRLAEYMKLPQALKLAKKLGHGKKRSHSGLHAHAALPQTPAQTMAMHTSSASDDAKQLPNALLWLATLLEEKGGKEDKGQVHSPYISQLLTQKPKEGQSADDFLAAVKNPLQSMKTLTAIFFRLTMDLPKEYDRTKKVMLLYQTYMTEVRFPKHLLAKIKNTGGYSKSSRFHAIETIGNKIEQCKEQAVQSSEELRLPFVVHVIALLIEQRLAGKFNERKIDRLLQIGKAAADIRVEPLFKAACIKNGLSSPEGATVNHPFFAAKASASQVSQNPAQTSDKARSYT